MDAFVPALAPGVQDRTGRRVLNGFKARPLARGTGTTCPGARRR